MGRPLARRALDSGHDVWVWNRTPGKTAALVEAGAAAARSPAHAATNANVVVTMVSDERALRAVVAGPDGVAAGIRPGSLLIEMSTVGRPAVDWLASVLPSGVELLDAPVLGSVSEAESGTLQLFVGGPADVVARWRPFLETFGTVVRVGPLGAGAAAKLVANSALFGVLGVLGEAVALARGAGLADDAALAVLSATPVGPQVERRRAALSGAEPDVRFPLGLARKDADLVVRMAETTGVDVRVARAALTWLTDAEREGGGTRDYSSVLDLIAQQSARRDGAAGA